MPISSAGIGAITGAVGATSDLLGGIIGSVMQRNLNESQRDYETETYRNNKADALDFWMMQNAYNSPEAQMQRLKSAGLNPNLVYGNGATTVAADLQAPTPHPSNSTKVINPMENFHPQMVLSNMYDFKVKDAQANLLNEQAKTQQTQRDLNAITALLRRYEATSEETKAKLGKETYDTQKAVIEASYQNLLAQMANTRSQTRLNDQNTHLSAANTRLSIDENVRKWQMQGGSLAKLSAEIENTKASTDERRANLGLIAANTANVQQQSATSKSQQALNELDKFMAENNLNRHSSGVAKIIDRLMYTIHNMSVDPKVAVDHAMNQLKSYIH